MKQTAFQRSAHYYQTYGSLLLFIICCLLPLKLSLTYGALIPLLLLFLLARWREIPVLIKQTQSTSIPFLFFLAAAFLSALFGFRPLSSAIDIGRLAFLALTTLCTVDLLKQDTARCRHCLYALISAQAIASLYSIFESAYPTQLPSLFIGTVSESGQLTLIMPMAIGLAIACASEKTSFLAIGSGLGLLLVGLVFGSVVKPEYGALIHLAAYLWLAVALIWPLVHAVKLSDNKTYALLTSLAIPLVTAALILNLKRGPWLGVLVATFLLLWFYRKKWLLLLLAAITVSFLMVPDVKNRLAASEEHFFIAGGRSAIWQIGFDLAPRYPLGIGFENSGVLRNYSDEVPPELTHFHNNFLNILVETGLFGLLCYLWWVAALLAKSIVPALKTQRTDWDIERRSHSVVLCSLGLAILAWQIAGLVEYNFGDSEVLLVALLLWGFLESIALQSSRHASRTTL